MAKWLIVLGAVAILEGYAIHRGEGTITECTVELFHTQSPGGKVALAATVGAIATWFVWHCAEYSGQKSARSGHARPPAA